MDNPDKLLTRPREGDDIYQRGIERGLIMADFVESHWESLRGKRVLDLGCAWGGITLAFAPRCDTIIGLEPDIWRVQAAWKRAREAGIPNASFGCGSALAIPFADHAFDLVIMNGVLEWVASRDIEGDPRRYQLQALQEIRRVLKTSGRLYLAIENRWFPRYLLSDPHVKLPLVAMLPRRLANIVCRALSGRLYRTYIYSHRALKALVRQAGFEQLSTFMPIPNYQFPLSIVGFKDREAISAALSKLSYADDDYHRIAGRGGSKVALWFRAITSLGVGEWLCPGFVLLAQPRG